MNFDKNIWNPSKYKKNVFNWTIHTICNQFLFILSQWDQINDELTLV